MKYQLLFIDDNVDELVTCQSHYEELGYRVKTASTGEAGVEILKEEPGEFAAVVVDFQLGDMDGISTAKLLKQINPALNVALYTGRKGDSSKIQELLLDAGVIEFIEKKPSWSNLDTAISDMCRKYEITCRKLTLDEDKTSNAKLIESVNMIGRSTGSANVVRRIILYRQNRKNVLILGETGVGKQKVAEALHQGPREKFFQINCGEYASNDTLLRGELFGYVKGAFTDAKQDQAGILELARGGTVLLDEIHFLSIEAQAALLKALSEHQIRRVGGNKTIPVDFRLIAAGKANLESLVDQGKFLPDLFERLNNFCIEVPPLRERISDIEPLVSFFCKKYFEETGTRKTFLMSAIRRLESYEWPRNVRELQHKVEQILYHTKDTTITSDHLESRFFRPSKNRNPVSYSQLLKKHDAEKREAIVSAMGKYDGVVVKAAKFLSIKVDTLRTILRRDTVLRSELTNLGVKLPPAGKREMQNGEVRGA